MIFSLKIDGLVKPTEEIVMALKYVELIQEVYILAFTTLIAHRKLNILK